MLNQDPYVAEVRIYAVEELLLDFKKKNLYISGKLLLNSRMSYFGFLKEALLYGSVNDFAEYLTQHNCLTAAALTTKNAAWSLAYNEFKRYYIRGVCRQAIVQKKLLRVCRYRTSMNVSEDSGNLVDEILRPEPMLNAARKIPGISTENEDNLEQRILRPNSGLGVEISSAKPKENTLNI